MRSMSNSQPQTQSRSIRKFYEYEHRSATGEAFKEYELTIVVRAGNQTSALMNARDAINAELTRRINALPLAKRNEMRWNGEW